MEASTRRSLSLSILIYFETFQSTSLLLVPSTAICLQRRKVMGAHFTLEHLSKTVLNLKSLYFIFKVHHGVAPYTYTSKLICHQSSFRIFRSVDCFKINLWTYLFSQTFGTYPIDLKFAVHPSVHLIFFCLSINLLSSGLLVKQFG